MQRALYPGSFDPPTLGHFDLMRRAAAMVDELWIGIGRNAAKSGGLFEVDERVEMLREFVQAELAEAEVRVVTFDGLVVDFCREHDIGVILRGIRDGRDAGYELPMAQMNRTMHGAVETVFLVADPALGAVASSLVKDVVRYGGDATAFVSPAVERRMRARLLGEAAE